MLTSLRIANFVLIEETLLEPDRGLTVITGETGAGKSVVLAAINLLLGDRAGDDFIRRGADEARLEAVFDLENAPAARRVLDDFGLEPCDEVLIRRRIQKGGKSRCYVNNSPATVSQLRELGETLINIHGQNEHQCLLSGQSQLAILDAFGALPPELERYSALYRDYRAAREKLEALRDRSRNTDERCDFLSFQIDEIEQADLGSDEDEEELKNEKTRLENLSGIQDSVAAVLTMAQSDEGGAEALLARIRNEMEGLAEIDSSFADRLETMDNAIIMLKDVLGEVESYADGLVFDEERYRRLDDRGELIRKLLRKHGPTLEDVRRRLEEFREELDSLVNSDAAITQAEKREKELAKELRSLGAGIMAKRRKAADLLAGRVQKELCELNIPHAVFEIELSAAAEPAPAPGAARFMISLNKGQPARPLAKIASGGEMSRVMLAIKNVVAEHDEVPTLIFDEIDANVGGEAASAVGRKLAAIAGRKQVLCITHLPHIARLGGTHVKVSKHSPDGAKTVSRAEILSREGRERELARMLSGENVSALTIKHARELLGTE